MNQHKVLFLLFVGVWAITGCDRATEDEALFNDDNRRGEISRRFPSPAEPPRVVGVQSSSNNGVGRMRFVSLNCVESLGRGALSTADALMQECMFDDDELRYNWSKRGAQKHKNYYYIHYYYPDYLYSWWDKLFGWFPAWYKEYFYWPSYNNNYYTNYWGGCFDKWGAWCLGLFFW